MRERRERIIWIADRLMVDIFDWRRPGYLRLPVLGNLPAGYEVVYAWHDPERKAVAFVLYHDSFDPVPEGYPTPALTNWDTVTVEMAAVPFTQDAPDEPLRINIPS